MVDHQDTNKLITPTAGTNSFALFVSEFLHLDDLVWLQYVEIVDLVVLIIIQYIRGIEWPAWILGCLSQRFKLIYTSFFYRLCNTSRKSQGVFGFHPAYCSDRVLLSTVCTGNGTSKEYLQHMRSELPYWNSPLRVCTPKLMTLRTPDTSWRWSS